ncbi:MAG: SurA N-terminal domain-containing protein [Polyangiales bacterium]
MSTRAALCFILCGAIIAPSAARAEIVESVAAIVNDQAILLSDLRRRAAPFLEQIVTGASTDIERSGRIKQLYKRMLQQLVDEELIEQAARKSHISVSMTEVDQAIDNVRRQNSLTEDAFWQAVRAQGFSEKTYRDDVRKQLLRLKVINQRVRSRINIGDGTVRETYDDRVRDARRSQKFHAVHLFTPLPQTASATEVARAFKEARELRKQLTPQNFDAFAAKQGGGDLGWLDQGDLPAVLEEALLGLSQGEIGEPVRGPSGVHIFLLRERQSGATKIPTFEEARTGIQRELLDKAMQRQEELFIKGLRQEAVVVARQ